MPDTVESLVRSIIQVLHDGHLGFAELGHHLKDHTVKEFFLKESLNRQQFAGELEAELQRSGVHDVKEGGTATGAIHRAWGELKAHLGGSDHTLLVTAEESEDEAKRAYQKALEHQELPLPLRQILVKQQEHILSVHEKIKAFRDNRAA
jgi:uncharacterized protein (TIGR02284 family)